MVKMQKNNLQNWKVSVNYGKRWIAETVFSYIKRIFGELHLYFNGLSLRNTSKVLSRFVQRSHTAIRDWIQKYRPKRLFCNKIKIAEFIIDETQIKVGSELVWLWVIIEPESKKIIGMSLSKERNMFVAETIYL